MEYVEREAVIAKSHGGVVYIDDIKNIPSADVAPVRHGKWLVKDNGWGGTYYTCTDCGEDWVTVNGTPAENKMKYCPACGAKMDLED